MSQQITPYLWFDGQAEEAATYYVSVFDDGRILNVQRYGEGGPAPAGTAMIVELELNGQRFIALNGGPQHTFSEAVSFHVSCREQSEVDRLWKQLTADGGEPGQCGWLKDRWGLSWQIIPVALPEMLGDSDPERAGRVVRAMLGMQKIDIQGLRDAYDGRD
ncbi:VOC family protein [Plantactinospora sp. GCM10030261]|uniref:VOC family protein n=1 Tax=Plantactinospora sp. GCM10030261 TaxID=3273420 RepID=UPI003615FD94